MTPSKRVSGSVRSRQLVRAYLVSLPPDARKRMRLIREIVHALAPKAAEVFSYGIPAFRLNGKPLIYYAAWKEHVSLYPLGASVKRSLGKRLKRYETSKGTLRLPLTRPFPVTLVRMFVRARMSECLAQGESR
jgi:uncharacterized protein YdhG (YjbR/CyaY superfamily)